MAGPIVFISHQRVKPGRFEAFAAFFVEGSKAIERDKPGTLVFLAFTDPERGETRIVHVFPDAEAMDRHTQGAAERSARRMSSSSRWRSTCTAHRRTASCRRSRP
jgi:quinol monooxygenase YgiN